MAGVGDEGVPAVGRPRGVARLGQAGQHVADLQCPVVDQRHLAEHGVSDDRRLPHAFDAARPRAGRDVRAHDAEIEIDDGDSRLRVGRDERQGR